MTLWVPRRSAEPKVLQWGEHAHSQDESEYPELWPKHCYAPVLGRTRSWLRDASDQHNLAAQAGIDAGNWKVEDPGWILDFDGANNEFYTASGSPAFQSGEAEITIFAWFRATADPAGNTVIAELYQDSSNYIWFRHHGSDTINLYGYLGGTFNAQNGVATLSTLGWITVAVVCSYSGGYKRIYVNGQIDAQGGLAGGSNVDFSSPAITVGCNSSGTYELTDGNIALVAFYPNSLSPAQIAYLNRDPTCFLRPRRRWFGIGVGEGTPVSQTAASLYEAEQALLKQRLSNWESALSLISSKLSGYESVQALSNSKIKPWESLSAPAASKPARLEALQAVSGSAGTPWESAGKLLKQAASLYEAISQLSQSNTNFWEALEGVGQASGPLYETLQTIVGQRATAWEAAGTLKPTAETGYESTQPVNQSEQTQWESLLRIARQRVAAWESLKSCLQSGIHRWEAAGVLTKSISARWESEGKVVEVTLTPTESLTSLSRARSIDYEALASIVATRLTPWEAQGTEAVIFPLFEFKGKSRNLIFLGKARQLEFKGENR